MTAIEAAEREADVLIHEHESLEFRAETIARNYRRDYMQAVERLAEAKMKMDKAIAYMRALQAAAKEGGEAA
jgi:hypothetical protein